MADGTILASKAAIVSGPAGKNGFFVTRRGVLTIVAIAAALALAIGVALNWKALVEAPFPDAAGAWLWLGVASCTLWLPLLLMLLDTPDNMATGPGIALPVATFVLLFGLAVASLAFSPAAWAGSVPLEPALAAFFAIFATTMIARIWNAALFARYASAQYRARQDAAVLASARGDDQVKEVLTEVAAHKKEQGNAEALSALIGTAGVGLVVLLAAVAGSLDPGTRVSEDIALVTAALVAGVFAVVFMLDWLAETPPVRATARFINGASHGFKWLADFYNGVDFLFVRIGAQAAGAGHNHWIVRYLVLGGTQACLAVMTWFLPNPLGLVPALVGFTLALSVSRLWAWVEEDRNLAMITQFNPNAPRRIGFKEDYRDEAIFGFMFVLLLIPMAMKQADAGALFGLQYFQIDDHGARVDALNPAPWFAYFSFELAKALPVIDWADIYLKSGFDTSMKAYAPNGQHATFIARALVDLVLVAALLQAISITVRNRQQKALYAARQIDRLDEMVERVELRKALRRPQPDWFTGGVDFRHYNRDRLRELHSDTADAQRKAFIELIFDQARDSVGFALAVLETLARRRAPIEDLMATFRTVMREHATEQHRIEPTDLVTVFEELRAVEGLRDFKFRMLDFALDIGAAQHEGPPADLAILLEQVIFDARRDQFQYTRIHAAQALTRIVPRLVERDRLAALLASVETDREVLFGARQFVPDQLRAALIRRLQEIGPPTA